jgi:hypothetical protein
MKKKITINNLPYEIAHDFKGGHLLSLLPSIAGEQFRGYWLQKIGTNGIDTAVENGTEVSQGDNFWAIPPCHK